MSKKRVYRKNNPHVVDGMFPRRHRLYLWKLHELKVSPRICYLHAKNSSRMGVVWEFCQSKKILKTFFLKVELKKLKNCQKIFKKQKNYFLT